MAAAIAIGADRPNRWAASLADVGADSLLHAAAVVDAIGMVMPALSETPPAKLVPLLRLLDELVASSGTGPAEAARPTLERFTAGGASQAARLARSTLSRARPA